MRFDDKLKNISDSYKNVKRNFKNKIFLLSFKNNRNYDIESIINNEYERCLMSYVNNENITFYDVKTFEFNGDVRNIYVDLLSTHLLDCENVYEAAMRVNIELYKRDLCPLVYYSFGRWNFETPVNCKNVANLLEFSYIYLFRCIEYESPYIGLTCLSKKGAVFNVYMDEGQVCKIPKTFASFYFLSKEEFNISMFLAGTGLKKFIPRNYLFNEEFQIITHEFVEGISGEEYLEEEKNLESIQIANLREFYEEYKKILNKGIRLDIHPGNFVWNESLKQWFLIDLGEIPVIGKEYYEFDEFTDYYKYIWLERKKTMKKVPIRSFDFQLFAE